ncbi:PrsW family intramembrane metalloprotease [Pseudolysinimonas yzui]|uniref:Protease PrsW n=1 Tax=Pseudolysinimonas yzui TaxID=2708254 RepID=A0A8J3GPI4_9MICO|nr:PrsW family intramembrane metalloprotease [Pseudolysinimonas yzui]GHF11576.1 protease PrsW [Pseudolysinimonas yzui]
MSQATPDNSTATVTAHAAQQTSTQLPQQAPAEVKAATAVTPQAIFDVDPRWRPGMLAGVIIGGIVLLIALILVVAYFLLFLGPGLSFIGGVLALIPLAIVLLGVRWIDRWEPEPRLLLLIAFLWGATVSIVIALVADVGTSYLYAAGGADVNMTVFLQSTVQAPIVEEVGKGLGILLIYLVARRYFDGPVDGIVFAALVGGGFAFTENIQYFAIQIAESGTLDFAVGEIFFIRGILSPFAHVMFSAFTGFFIGLAARKGTALGGILMFFVGLIPAILLHAFWNGVLFFIYDFYGYYLVVQVPLFAIAVVTVILLRRREAQMTQLRLGEYAAAGWFNVTEVNTLGTAAGRRQARAWARQRGLSKVMKEYIKDATHLAFTRNRIVSGRDRIGSQQDEAVLLAQVSESRARLAAATPANAAVATPPATPPTPPAG